MESVVSSLFQLVLEVPFKFALNAIDKNLGVFKVYLEKSLEL